MRHHSEPRDMVNNDFDYECQYAATSAKKKYSTWEAYVAGALLDQRFPANLDELRTLYEKSIR